MSQAAVICIALHQFPDAGYCMGTLGGTIPARCRSLSPVPAPSQLPGVGAEAAVAAVGMVSMCSSGPWGRQQARGPGSCSTVFRG